MERQQALKILNALANGVHPATGEPASHLKKYAITSTCCCRRLSSTYSWLREQRLVTGRA